LTKRKKHSIIKSQSKESSKKKGKIKMLKCERCSAIFDESELRCVFDPVGECGDRTAYVERGLCPECGNDEYEEAFECAVCGEYFTTDELAGNICRECLHKYDRDFETCREASLGWSEKVEINALLASLFTPSDIEDILFDYIRTKKPDINCAKFIDECDCDFAYELEDIIERRKRK
jgi:hypothetical protein